MKLKKIIKKVNKMRKILKKFVVRMRWAKVIGYRTAFDRDFLKVFVGEE